MRTRRLLFAQTSGWWNLRVDGVVEDPRESKVDVANQLIQVVIRLQPQGVCGLVCFYDNL